MIKIIDKNGKETIWKKNNKSLRIQKNIIFQKYKEKYSLSMNCAKELTEYISIFKDNAFKEHHEVNTYIDMNNMWDKFHNIRSLNDHGYSKNIKGIQPKYFKLICEELKIKGFEGAPLIKAMAY